MAGEAEGNLRKAFEEAENRPSEDSVDLTEKLTLVCLMKLEDLKF
jgi:hypothetical protein